MKTLPCVPSKVTHFPTNSNPRGNGSISASPRLRRNGELTSEPSKNGSKGAMPLADSLSAPCLNFSDVSWECVFGGDKEMEGALKTRLWALAHLDGGVHQDDR